MVTYLGVKGASPDILLQNKCLRQENLVASFTPLPMVEIPSALDSEQRALVGKEISADAAR